MFGMNTITIPRNLVKNDDLIVLPRKEYEALVGLKQFKEFTPTVALRKALVSAEKNFSSGKTLSYDGLIKKLGFAN